MSTTFDKRQNPRLATLPKIKSNASTIQDVMFSHIMKQDINSHPQSPQSQLQMHWLYSSSIPTSLLFPQDQPQSLPASLIPTFLSQYHAHNPSLLHSRQANFKICKLSMDRYYIGEMFNGKCHGFGVIVFRDGRLYEGLLQNNLKQGQGLLVNADRSWYYGEYSNDKKDGEGLEVTSKWTYKGVFVNGVKHGMGGLVAEGVAFNGEWRMGVVHGVGVLQAQGGRYEGSFANGHKHGRGRETFENGDMFEGNYSNGKPNGEGQYRWKRDGCVFKGNFVNGQREGKGVWMNPSGDKYAGDYKEDLKSGYGQFKWNSGNFYKGNYLEDLREGYGQMFWTNGSVYKGQWHLGLQHGRGELYVPGQGHITGIFHENILVNKLDSLNTSMMDFNERKKSEPTTLEHINYRKRLATQTIPHKKSKGKLKSKQKSSNINNLSKSKSPLHKDHSAGGHHRFCKACILKQISSRIDMSKNQTLTIREKRKGAVLKQLMRNQAAQYMGYRV